MLDIIRNTLIACARYLIIFKTKRQESEWKSGKLDKRLTNIIIIFSIINVILNKKKTIITDIYRTQEENDQIYEWWQGCGRKRKVSVHSFWRGIDIRVGNNGLTDSEAILLTNIMNGFIYDKNRPTMKTALYGDNIHKNHVHLQTAPI